MSYLKKYIKKKILRTYNNFDIEDLKYLKKIQKNLLKLDLDKDKNIDLTIKGLFYYNLFLPHFSKFYIFLYSFKIPLVFPLPLSHLTYLRKNNVNCIISLSLIFFYVYIVYISTKRIFSTLKFILKIKKCTHSDNTTKVYFPNIYEQEYIPNPKKNDQEYTFIKSCLTELNLNPENIYHSNPNIEKFSYKGGNYQYGFPINGLSIKKKFLLFIFAMYSYILSLFLFFRWKNFFILDQRIYKFFFELSNKDKANNDNVEQKHVIYDFKNQLLRPYWTYFADEQHYKFYLINTASGFYGFKDSLGKYPVDTMYHHLCNFENYYVDSPIFFKYLKDIIPTAKLFKNKISPFHIYEEINFNNLNQINVAIFDVVPATLFRRALLLPEDRYRVSSTCISFLSDIIKCLNIYNVTIYLKIKHNLNSINFPADYIDFIKNLNGNKIIKLNPRYSPKLLSSKVHFSISSPFTTAAFYETITNNNFFYDPINYISNDDRAKQNLELVSGFDCLNNHLEKIIGKITNCL